jgi:phospholipase/carboxylesterase
MSTEATAKTLSILIWVIIFLFMLTYETRGAAPSDATAPLIILMHGRGATRFDLLSLNDHMPANATVVFPEAPFEAAPWGYGPGSAWYRFLGGNKPEAESFSRSLDALHELIVSFNRARVVVGGFSQGGTMGMAYALANPGTISGVLNLSGFLADHPRIAATPANVADTSFFWGHGTHDPAIPFRLAIEGRELLRAAGAKLETHDYEIGHWIAPEELEHAVAWLDNVD